MVESKNSIPVLTIDGPSGAGKGTVSVEIAKRLGWHFLDSGAFYRAIGLAATWQNLDLSNASQLEKCAQQTQVEFQTMPDGSTAVRINGIDSGNELRTESTAAAASSIAAIPQVRSALLQRQRQFRQAPGLVADGRDMGTVVFADAPFKVFLTASAEERANRRYKQLNEKGLTAKLAALLREIEARDYRDANREVAPLKPADDALVIDTTHTPIAEVVDLILSYIESDSKV